MTSTWKFGLHWKRQHQMLSWPLTASKPSVEVIVTLQSTAADSFTRVWRGRPAWSWASLDLSPWTSSPHRPCPREQTTRENSHNLQYINKYSSIGCFWEKPQLQVNLQTSLRLIYLAPFIDNHEAVDITVWQGFLYISFTYRKTSVITR